METKNLLANPGGMLWRGIIAIAFGVSALIWPGITLNVLVILFAIFALIDGAAAIVTAIATGKEKKNLVTLILEGVVGLVIGILILLWPDVTLLVLIYFVAIWAVITGLFEIAISFSFKEMPGIRWFMLVAGIISLALGILIFVYPIGALVVITWLIGLYAIIFGILLIIIGIKLKKEKKDTEGPKQIQEEE